MGSAGEAIVKWSGGFLALCILTGLVSSLLVEPMGAGGVLAVIVSLFAFGGAAICLIPFIVGLCLLGDK